MLLCLWRACALLQILVPFLSLYLYSAIFKTVYPNRIITSEKSYNKYIPALSLTCEYCCVCEFKLYLNTRGSSSGLNKKKTFLCLPSFRTFCYDFFYAFVLDIYTFLYIKYIGRKRKGFGRFFFSSFELLTCSTDGWCGCKSVNNRNLFVFFSFY